MHCYLSTNKERLYFLLRVQENSAAPPKSDLAWVLVTKRAARKGKNALEVHPKQEVFFPIVKSKIKEKQAQKNLN